MPLYYFTRTCRAADIAAAIFDDAMLPLSAALRLTMAHYY